MKKIIVAGAGHGGLVAAYHLAKNGFEVSAYEKSPREALGHDWHDYLDMTAFEKGGIPQPDKELYTGGIQQAFRNPKGTVRLEIPIDELSLIMDRRVLAAYLVHLAEEAGVQLHFGCEITGVCFDNTRITGIRLKAGDKEKRVTGELVIDAAGINSPVRQTLPAFCSINRGFTPENIFYVYRAYYKNEGPVTEKIPYVIDLFHMNRPGIGWTIFTKEHTDILFGKFGSAGPLTAEEVESALESYRKEYPFISKEIIRGGSFEQIPLDKMLPLIVADGYAAVGDSAGMTVPLNGSGINLSMHAGRLLADCVIADNECSLRSLWRYQYKYFLEAGKDQVMINKLKTFFVYVTGEDVDYLLESGILSPELIASGGKDVQLTPAQILDILSKAAPLIRLIPNAVKTFAPMVSFSQLVKTMPEEYEENAVKEWINKYSAL